VLADQTAVWHSGIVSQLNLTVTVAAPTLDSISPSTGPTAGGTSVTITGTNFISGATVTIGGSQCIGITIVSTTSITAVTPPGTTGAKNIVVTTPRGSATLTGAFTYYADPAVTTISPTSGPATGGTLVTIHGTLFTGATGVSFGGIPATDFIVDNDSQITATTPAHAAGSADVTVTNAGGTSFFEAFTYITLDTTITFDANGGSPTPASITQAPGLLVTSHGAPTKTGYTFAGWLPAVPATQPASDMTCVAQWTTVNSRIIIVKNTLSVTDIFGFTGTGGNGLPVSFSINPIMETTFTGGGASASGFTGSQTYNVAPGKYTITEANLPADWSLYSSVDQEGVEHLGQSTIDVIVAADETAVICFNNHKTGEINWPIPEMPAGLLLGTGIAGMSAYIFIKRRKAASVIGK